MRIGFVVNDIQTEHPNNTTPFLMLEAHRRGHEVFLLSVGDFSFQHDGRVSIRGRALPPKSKCRDTAVLLGLYQGPKAREKLLRADQLDVLFLRNNPTEENSLRQWAEHAGIVFGRVMQQQGVLVLNDAYTLSHAFVDKLYFEELPAEIKPASIITRSKEDILQFFEEHNRQMVLKPLEGSGGRDVFLIDENEKNINQIIETIGQHGYLIAQEYLPEAKKGDIRVMLVNGRLPEIEENHAMIRRIGGKGDFRNNFSQGARPEKAELSPEIKRIIELTAPKLIKDGLFLVGLDVVGDKLIELNLLSPGGLHMMKKIGLGDFGPHVISAIERKLEYRKHYGPQIPNRVLATME